MIRLMSNPKSDSKRVDAIGKEIHSGGDSNDLIGSVASICTKTPGVDG